MISSLKSMMMLLHYSYAKFSRSSGSSRQACAKLQCIPHSYFYMVRFSLLSSWSFLLFSALFSALSATVAQADTLTSWRFDARQNQLEFTTDEEVQPTAQLVPNPSRVVIDLPGIRLGRPKVTESLGGSLQALRIGQFNAGTARLVVELAPGYTIDPQQVKVRGTSATRWIVQLPAPKLGATNPLALPQPIATIAPPTPPANTFGGLVPAGRSLNWLQQRLRQLKSGKYASLGVGLSVLDLETGNYLDLNGDKAYPTASMIKLPILMAFFQDVDAGKIRLDETLTMTRDVVVGGSGEMQDLPIGSKFSAWEVADKMITISDNTATNMIIKRMGGLAVVNQRFRDWGLRKTVMRNWLPDLSGTNTTTTKEFMQLLTLLDRQKLLSSRSQSQALDILSRVRNRKLLPVGLGSGAKIAHKTGDIGFILGDGGIITMPTGKRYLAAVLVESEYNDPAARDFIQDASRLIYTYLSQPQNERRWTQMDADKGEG
jgi:beta-lactamase class A